MWRILQALALFTTAGMVFAKDVFNTIGINADSSIIIAVGLGITTMLIAAISTLFLPWIQRVFVHK